jgi:AcrR family transcriptional regulator
VPNRRSREETCEKILKATLDLISETGLEGFTISDVARRAAVNRALIYHYYNNRVDLVTSAIDSLMTLFDTPETLLSGDAVARSARMYISHPEIGRLIFQLLLSGRPLERLGQRFANTLKHVEVMKQQQAPDSVGDAKFGMVTLGLAQLSWSFSRDQLASILGMSVEAADDRFVEELRRVSELGLQTLFAQAGPRG